MLGANVGNEAFYGALHFGLKTRAIEIMCNLVDKAKAVKAQFAAKHRIEFECMDCLKADISHAKLVYLDNEIWDNFLTTEVYRKMGTELPVGALVIGWKKDVHQPNHGWKDLGSIGVLTSWSDDLQDVFVLERTTLQEADAHKEGVKTSEAPTPGTQLTEDQASKWFDALVEQEPLKTELNHYSWIGEDNDLCEPKLDAATCVESSHGPAKAIVVNTGKSFGKVLHIGCEPVLTEADAFVHYELVAHLALNNLKTPARSVFIAGGGSLGMIREVPDPLFAVWVG